MTQRRIGAVAGAADWDRRALLAAMSAAFLGGPALGQALRPTRLLVIRKPGLSVTNACVAPCVRGQIFDISAIVGTVSPAAIVASGAEPLCDTIERPWKNNLPSVSSIPKGVYRAAIRTDATKPWMVGKPNRAWRLELAGVPNGRTAIQFHFGADEKWSEGCFIIGDHLVTNTALGITPAYCKLTNGEATVAALRSCVTGPGRDSKQIEITVADVSDLFTGAQTTC